MALPGGDLHGLVRPAEPDGAVRAGAGRRSATADSAAVRRGARPGDWSTPRLVIVAIGVASILFDGLSQTQIWFDVFGFPALPIATLELLAFLGIVIGVALVLTRSRRAWPPSGAGLLPIAMGYLVAHYLTYLLADGQLIVVALSDPLQLGWDLLRHGVLRAELGASRRSSSGRDARRASWAGTWSARGPATSWPASPTVGAERRVARLRQIPLAILMVGLTATTLWSLGQAIVKEAPTAGRRPQPPRLSAAAVDG